MRGTLAFLLGAALLAIPAAVEAHDDSEFCKKGCSSAALRKEVESLEKELKASNPGLKTSEVEAKRERVRRHLAQHQAELVALQEHVDGPEANAAGQVAYACPMHPEVTSDKPGKCSKCGMNLEKKK